MGARPSAANSDAQCASCCSSVIVLYLPADGIAPYNANMPERFEGEIAKAFDERRRQRLEEMCKPPFKCDMTSANLTCPSSSANSPDSFFGKVPIRLGSEMYFPDFAWSLEADVVFRDGEELSPKEDYIDNNTLEVQAWVTFFVPVTQVATIFWASFDMTDIKPRVTVKFLQMKMLEGSDFWMTAGWVVAAIILALIGAVLAFPAAVQEIKEVIAMWRDDAKTGLQMAHPSSHNLQHLRSNIKNLEHNK
eukprot:scaffold191781_cov48-Prasinocladus_malaysianus.AAC.2